ncbi:MAG: hypothetical protein WBB82_17620 [Limnothrix sp.]
MEDSRALTKALNFLSRSQKSELETMILSRDSLMPHEIVNKLFITYEQALAFLLACQLYDFATTYLLIYHACTNDKYIESLPFDKGIPDLPFTCENCDEEIEDIAELSFDVIAYFQKKQKLLVELGRVYE